MGRDPAAGSPGAEAWIQWLRRERAEAVRDALVRAGVAPRLLSVEVDPRFRPPPNPVPALRRVDFAVAAEPPALTARLP